MDKTIKRMIINPFTLKRCNRVTILNEDGTLENFGWNTVYHLYNSTKNYRQMKASDLKYLVWSED